MSSNFLEMVDLIDFEAGCWTSMASGAVLLLASIFCLAAWAWLEFEDELEVEEEELDEELEEHVLLSESESEVIVC